MNSIRKLQIGNVTLENNYVHHHHVNHQEYESNNE